MGKTGSFQKTWEGFCVRHFIQPHFVYACARWYPNLNKKYKNKLQVLQSKLIVSAYNWTTEANRN